MRECWLDPERLKRIQMEQIGKEGYIFLSLCSQGDVDMVLGTEEMDLKDFDRIACLMQQLGFERLHIYFLESHADLLKELGERIEREANAPTRDVEKEMEIMQQWMDDFVEQLPTEAMKHFIGKALDLGVSLL